MAAIAFRGPVFRRMAILTEIMRKQFIDLAAECFQGAVAGRTVFHAAQGMCLVIKDYDPLGALERFFEPEVVRWDCKGSCRQKPHDQQD